MNSAALVSAQHLTCLLAAVALSACPSIDASVDGGLQDIIAGPQGGIFIRAGYALDIPAGALAEQVRIVASIVDTGIPEVPDRKRISYGYRLSPSSVRFAKPIRLFLPWLADRVPKAVAPATFDLRRNLGTEAYAQLPGTQTTLTPFEAVEAQTERLGLFWVTSPSQPNVDQVEISPESMSLEVGGVQAFVAQMRSPEGQTLEADVSWAVVPPRVASIDEKGVLTAKAPGVATVTASAGGQSATARVEVRGTTLGPRTAVHENPFPTGNDLFGGAFAPGGLGTVFVGANGTVLGRDSLNRWTRLFSAPGVTLTAVGGTSASNAVAIGRSVNSGVLVEFSEAVEPKVTVFPPLDISDLVALWFDGTHGMAVGAGNKLSIRRNGAWDTEYHPSFETLLGVIGNGAGAFVVVGDLGSLYQWDPSRKVWDSLYDTRLAVKLDAATLIDFSAPEAWAVGGNTLWHFVSGHWTHEDLPSAPEVQKTTCIAAFDNRIIVGAQAKQPADAGLDVSKGAILVKRLPDPDAGIEDSSWTSFALRGPQIPRGAFGGGIHQPAGFVVGDYGAVWSWNETSKRFEELSSGFYGDVSDVALLADDVVAAVNECTTLFCQERSGVVMHQGPNKTWVPLGHFPSGQGQVFAVAAKSATEVLAATSTALFRWNGTDWVSVRSELLWPITDLTACGTNMWAVDRGGSVYQVGEAALTPVDAPSGVSSIHCPSESDVWVAGDFLLAERFENGPWVSHSSDQVQHRLWKAVWSPGAGEAFAFGDARYGVYWDTEKLTAVESFGPVRPEIVTGLWGTSFDNLYLVGLAKLPGPFGFALRSNGVRWELIDLGAHRKPNAIAGRSPTDFWIATEGGGVLRSVAPN